MDIEHNFGVDKNAKQECSRQEIESEVRENLAKEEAHRQLIGHVMEDIRRAGDKVNFSEIGREHGLNAATVSRIAAGTARLDGKSGAGRPPHLSEAAEARVVAKAQELYSLGQVVRFGNFQELARTQWRLENLHSSKTEPLFERKWFDGFRQRHPQIALVADHVTPQTNKRWKSSMRSIVNEALQKLKRRIHELPGNRNGWVEDWRIMFADETDVTLNGESPGTRGYNPTNPQKPQMVAPKNESPHISCTAFASLDGRLISVVFVVAGNPSVEPVMSTLKPKNPIIFNESGSSEVNSPDGKAGSWSLIIDTFTKDLHASIRFEHNAPCLLIVDGLAAHMQSDVIGRLREEGVRQFVLDANLTHLVQLQDTPFIFGTLKGSLRRAQNESCNLNGNQLLPLEVRLYEVEKYVGAAHAWQHIRAAAKSIGFEFKQDNGATWVTMTDESISRVLDHLEFTGAIRKADDDFTGHDLRDRDFLNLRRLNERLGDDAPLLGQVLPQTEAQFRVQQEEFSILLNSRIGVESSKRPKRVSLKRLLNKANATCRAGTYIVNEDTSSTATRQRLANEVKKQKADQRARKRAREARRKVSLQRRSAGQAPPSVRSGESSFSSEQPPLFFDPFTPDQH